MKNREPNLKKPVCSAVHKVAAGETLYRIARRYGVDYGRLMALNGITNPQQAQNPAAAAPDIRSYGKAIRSTASQKISESAWRASWQPTAMWIRTICTSA